MTDVTSTELTQAPDDALPTADYAPWRRRFVAWLLDGLLTWVPLVVAAGVTGSIVGDPQARGDATDELAGGLVIMAGAPLLLLYHGFFRGRTPGKRAVGIAVRDESARTPIGFGRAVGRTLLTMVLWVLWIVPGVLDGLWPLWDRKRQALHDKATGTVVVRL